MSKRTELTERQRFWLAHLRRCERGHGSLKAYAVENGLGVSALYEAKSTLRRKGVLGDAITRPRFVRVEHEPEPGAAPMLCRVRLTNGVLVEMACAPGQWESVLQAAARLS